PSLSSDCSAAYFAFKAPLKVQFMQNYPEVSSLTHKLELGVFMRAIFGTVITSLSLLMSLSIGQIAQAERVTKLPEQGALITQNLTRYLDFALEWTSYKYKGEELP